MVAPRRVRLKGVAMSTMDGGPEMTLAVDDEFWSLKAVLAKTGLSRSTLYTYVAIGLFPKQRRLGVRRVAWLASEVREWISSRPK
jgi:prophage regulatory protein